MATPPIFISSVPVVQKVNCILQEGVRYCESNPVSPNQFGFLLIGLSIYMIYVMVCFWLSEKLRGYINELVVIFTLTILLPSLIGGIIAINL